MVFAGHLKQIACIFFFFYIYRLLLILFLFCFFMREFIIGFLSAFCFSLFLFFTSTCFYTLYYHFALSWRLTHKKLVFLFYYFIIFAILLLRSAFLPFLLFFYFFLIFLLSFSVCVLYYHVTLFFSFCYIAILFCLLIMLVFFSHLLFFVDIISSSFSNSFNAHKYFLD